MAIRDDIDARLREARLARDEATRNVIGMLKNKVLMELKSGRGRDEDDTLWLEVIGAYTKQLQKTVVEFEKAGERGRDALVETKFELDFCASFLPKKLDEAQTETILRQLAKDHDLNAPAHMGKLMGLVMKFHKQDMDGALAKTVADRILVGS